MTGQASEALAGSRINILLVVIGVFASITAATLGYVVGSSTQENVRQEAIISYADQMYKICFARERELESYNSQRARRSCEYLTASLD